MKSRSICASRDNLEAWIEPFLLAEEGDVALSPFAPRTKVKSASREFFSVCKVPSFAFQQNEVTFHLRFQRQSGSMNRPVSTCRRGRRCPVALCATDKGKKRKQVVFFRVQSTQLRLPAAWSHVPFALPETIWKHESTRLYLQKRATLPCRRAFALPRLRRWSKGGCSFQ